MVAFLGAYNSLFLAPEVSEEKLVTEKVTNHITSRAVLCPVDRGARWPKRGTHLTRGATVAEFTDVV